MHKNVAINWSIEFGPIIAFFIVLAFLGNTDVGFIIATGVFTILTAVALLTAYTREKRIAFFPIIAGASVIGFGLATVFFQNPLIFIVKDTFYNGFFAFALLGGLLFGKGLLKPLFGALFDMKEEGWYILSRRWGIMFLILTILNEVAWRYYGRDIWVMYKFWSTIATTVFGMYQITLARRFRNAGSSPWGMRIKLMREELLEDEHAAQTLPH
jgi:intracellular septation protein